MRVALPLAQTALHVDPLFTAAWNTLVHGRKRWLLFPPDTTRATLFPRGDADEALPASVYLQLVYPGLRGVQGIDVVQSAGEAIYVPENWWHAVVNLELSVALTANFTGARNVAEAVRGLLREGNPDLAARLSRAYGIALS